MQQVDKPSIALEMWRRSGALGSLLPALASVSDSTLSMLNVLRRPLRPSQDRRRVHRLAALFSECEPNDAERALKLLRFSNSDAEWIAQTLERWLRIAPELEAALNGEHPVSDTDIRKWVATVGRLRVPAAWRLSAARAGAQKLSAMSENWFGAIHSTYRRALQSAARDAVELARHAPPVKILRLIAQILDSQPDLAVEEISVDARSGCSDFSGVVDVYTAEAVHRFEFTWCCRWRAEQEGWKDYFGFPDQMRAAREYDFRCFAQWKSVKASQPSARHQLSLAR